MAVCSGRTFSYKIRPGDTLWIIARRFQTTVQAIMAENPMISERNLRIGQVICIPRSGQEPLQAFNCITKSELGLNNRIRSLWEQHVLWTRLFILSAVFGLPDADVTTQRILRNPKDFAAVLQEVYSEEIVATFVEAFTAHLTIAAELVQAAKAGDSAAAADAEKRWYENADKIAEFLGDINPFWSERKWKEMLYDHLAMTKTEAVHLLSGRYEESITIFDKIEEQALTMADTMTQGVVKQFPQAFR